jgi:hypothetical protein
LRNVPKPKAKKARPPERDYSHRSLLDKLGVTADLSVSIVGIRDADFLRDISARTKNIVRGRAAAGSALIFLGAESLSDLFDLRALRDTIAKNGGVWVVYPKGQKHIREIDVINAGKSAGLVDNKVASFSATHTALRFVIPLANR